MLEKMWRIIRRIPRFKDAFEADQDERQGDFSFPTYPCLGKYVKKSIFTLRKRNVEKPFVRAAWWFCSNSGVLFRNGLQRHSLPEIFYTVVTVFPSCSSNFTREGCRIARKLRSISIGVLFLKATLFVIILRQGQDYFRLSKFSLAPFTCTRTCIHCLTADCLQLCSFMDVNSWLPCHSQ